MLFPYKSRLRHWWNAFQFPAATNDCLLPGATWSRRQIRIAWAVLIAAALCVLAPNLSYPLIKPDETRYAQIALEMNASRDWVTPTLDAKAYLDKPPLMYWFTALSFSLFGTHESAARLPSLLSALLTVVVTFALGSKIVGRRAAWLSALSLVLCGGFVLAGRFLILDSLLTFFTTLCLLSGYLAVREPNHRWAWWMLSGIACAFGVLTKGPVALVLCAPPLVVIGWLRGDQTRTRAIHWAAFVVPMVMVCVPWYIAVIKFNPEFIDYFFWEHNFKRFTQGSNHQQPFWFYIPVVFAGMFPASLLLPSVAYFLASRSDRKRSLRSKDLGFLFCGVVWILGFFSIASCKLPTYILPAFPLMCLMLGVMLDRTVIHPEVPNRLTSQLRPFPQRASMTLTVCALVMIGIDVWLEGIGPTSIVMTLCCLVVGGLVLRWWNQRIAFSTRAWSATAALGITLLTFASAQLLPAIATSRSLYVRAAHAAESHPDTVVVFFGSTAHAAQMEFEPGRVVYFSNQLRDEFAGFIANLPEAIIVTGDKNIDSMRKAVSLSHKIDSFPLHKQVFLAKRFRSVPSIVPSTTPVSVASVHAERQR